MSANVLLHRLKTVEGRCVALQAEAANQVHALEITAAKAGAALEKVQLEVGQQKELIQKQDEEIRGLTGKLKAVQQENYALQDRLNQEMARNNYLQGDLTAAKGRNEGEIGRLQGLIEEKMRDREAMAMKLHAMEDRLAQEERRAADAERNREGERKEWEGTYDRLQDDLVRRDVEYGALAGQVDQQRDQLDQNRLDKGDLETVQNSLKQLKKGMFWLAFRAIFSKRAQDKWAAKKCAIKQLEGTL
ncbi:MAG TPA: hypothetical protein VLE89_04755 [Chlamydiales bacterium]|nr:hypothetical protein [Chlamydiales bacterium]